MDIANKVQALVKECLNGQESGAQIVRGIVHTFGFDPQKIQEHKADIAALLNEMPETFHKNSGGGWSFLNLCMDKHGSQWGEHSDMEALCALAEAAGMASYPLPRDTWNILPGGMPYVVFDTTPQTVGL